MKISLCLKLKRQAALSIRPVFTSNCLKVLDSFLTRIGLNSHNRHDLLSKISFKARHIRAFRVLMKSKYKIILVMLFHVVFRKLPFFNILTCLKPAFYRFLWSTIKHRPISCIAKDYAIFNYSESYKISQTLAIFKIK